MSKMYWRFGYNIEELNREAKERGKEFDILVADNEILEKIEILENVYKQIADAIENRDREELKKYISQRKYFKYIKEYYDDLYENMVEGWSNSDDWRYNESAEKQMRPTID